jgi:hypothetical protein
MQVSIRASDEECWMWGHPRLSFNDSRAEAREGFKVSASGGITNEQVLVCQKGSLGSKRTLSSLIWGCSED